MRPAYPWSAVVGQEALKHALLLCAIDPAIGGVLLSGPRGVAKSTLARALGVLLEGPFVELPLGASDDRVTGSLDLGSALSEGKVTFSPGLLARAHEGVLYVDEVNLLPDMLVDLLLDAAASGHNAVERDGISHSHPARFVLVGTMNPEEGELRPQLTDRFGLSVSAEPELVPQQRTEIVVRRLAYDAEPESFSARYEAEQAQLVGRCRAARARALTIPLSGPALSRVAELCYAAGVEGVRADLAMLRAARANAAWDGRDQISVEDVDAVAELALAHRRKPGSEPPPGGGAKNPEAGGGSSGSSSASGTGSSNDGALAPVPVRASATPTLPAWLSDSAAKRAERRRRGPARRSASAGRVQRERSGQRVDWFASLAHARGGLRAEDLRYRALAAPTMQHWVIAVDCSASMLRSGALAAAKAVAVALEANALRVGAHVTLLSFQGAGARVAASNTTSRIVRSHALHELAGGGGTPLGDALRAALAVCRRRPFDRRDVGKRVVLLTDGRTRETVRGVGPGDAELVVIDCERGGVRMGRARGLAAQLGATYAHVDAFTASSSST